MERLKISKNKRYFVKEDGTPFAWLADTDWTMPQRLPWHDIEYFMKKRKSQGFTVLQIVALDPEADEEIRNPAGHKALINNNLNTPNEDYFSYLDWIIKKAEEYGFYVLLLPIWGELVVGHNWMGKFSEKIMTEQNAYNYGYWIGNRYKDQKNIIWCLGGDRLPIHLNTDYRPVWRLLAEGIAEGVTGTKAHYNSDEAVWEKLLMTYHACHDAQTHECSTMSQWTEDEKWIRFIMLQSGHGLTPKNYELVKQEYDRANPMPVWDGEPAYEMMPTSWPEIKDFHGSWMVRKRAYWSLFAGAFGFTYGHSSVWCSVSEKERNHINRFTWFEALHSEGADQMKYLRDFMESTQIMCYHPCQEIFDAENAAAELDQHLQACINDENNTICIYMPSGGEATLSIGDKGFDTLQEWWFNPRNGKLQSKVADSPGTSPAGTANGLFTISAPSQGKDQDWVCILSKAAAEPPVINRCYYDFDDKTPEAKKVFEWD